ncbi:DUF6221 family protein [Streptomyces sp. NPDC088733]|uniref:DUF6221 family protein n=1 Tax=Streptomyces sp. NPDC088733 TaxID=3365880 RepID=UPI00380D0F77
MDDLVGFLRARLDEDAAVAHAAADGPWTPWRSTLHGLGDLLHPVSTAGQKPGARAGIATSSWLDAEHIARWDPARVLAEVDSKRRAFELLHDEGGDLMFADVFKLMALPYADHPDYEDGWRP